MLLPPALGSSPYPPVSVYGTGMCGTIAAFLGTQHMCFPTHVSVHFTAPDRGTDLPLPLLFRLYRVLLPRPTLSACVPTVLMAHSTGISTCCPSATPSGLALGPDSPRADQLYPGNLGYPAGRIPTSLSLLIPAFSLPNAPLLLAGTASARWQCSSTGHAHAWPLGFGGVFQPRTFSAQDLSTSELLRTL